MTASAIQSRELGLEAEQPTRLKQRLGMTQSCAAHRLARDLELATRATDLSPVDPAFAPAIQMVEGMKPKSDAEAIVAAQLAALNPLMMAAAGYALRSESAMGFSHWTGETVKLARATALLAETLSRMQRGGAQRVVIERVEVRDGGQAIVGAVGSQREGAK